GLIARWIVGISGTNQTGQWKFTPTSRAYATVTRQIDQEYAALLMGDVSGDWSPTGSRPFETSISPLPWESVLVSIPGITADTGRHVTIPVRFDNLNGEAVSSFQFTLRYDPKVLNPQQAAADLTG